MRRNFTVLACLALACFGLAAAMLVSPAARADGTIAYQDLPSMGFALTVIPDVTHSPVCLNIWASGNGAPLTLLGDPDTQHFCQTDAAMQARIVQLVHDYPTLPATSATTTAPVDTAPAPVAAPAAPDPQTTTVTVTVTDPTVQAKLDALQAQLDALAHRVDAIAQANTASWDAFVAAIGAGSSAVDAAIAARSAGLNAIYGL